MTGTKFIQINVNYYAKGTHLCTICIQEQYNQTKIYMCVVQRQ